MYLFFGIFFILALIGCICFWRRACIIKNIHSMPQAEKFRLINEVCRPFGYQYLPRQDVFVSTFDAWQRAFSYAYSYDRYAPLFNMVFDCEPVYFDYAGRTWLIEVWKGQYGVTTGAEIGIYCADGVVPPEKRKRTLFHTIEDADVPNFSMNLYRNNDHGAQEIASLSMPHWWLGVFRLGVFSRPKNLRSDFCVGFRDCGMACAFADALIRLGYDVGGLMLCDSCVCFSFNKPRTPQPCGVFARLLRRPAQWKNALFVRLYRFVTRPFYTTADRLLLLYYGLPFAFRRCLRPRRRHRRRTLR